MNDPDPEAEVPLAFEAWADLSARMVKLDEEARENLLEELDLDIEAWSQCDRYYGLMLAADIRAGRMDRAKAYASRFANKIATNGGRS
jgi:hypothetical protein